MIKHVDVDLDNDTSLTEAIAAQFRKQCIAAARRRGSITQSDIEAARLFAELELESRLAVLRQRYDALFEALEASRLRQTELGDRIRTAILFHRNGKEKV